MALRAELWCGDERSSHPLPVSCVRADGLIHQLWHQPLIRAHCSQSETQKFWDPWKSESPMCDSSIYEAPSQALTYDRWTQRLH